MTSWMDGCAKRLNSISHSGGKLFRVQSKKLQAKFHALLASRTKVKVRKRDVHCPMSMLTGHCSFGAANSWSSSTIYSCAKWHIWRSGNVRVAVIEHSGSGFDRLRNLVINSFMHLCRAADEWRAKKKVFATLGTANLRFFDGNKFMSMTLITRHDLKAYPATHANGEHYRVWDSLSARPLSSHPLINCARTKWMNEWHLHKSRQRKDWRMRCDLVLDTRIVLHEWIVIDLVWLIASFKRRQFLICR